ncbi:MAG: hypothetical protein ACLU37_07360 [Collinsella sp.]
MAIFKRAAHLTISNCAAWCSPSRRSPTAVVRRAVPPIAPGFRALSMRAVGSTLQERYFADYGTSAAHLCRSWLCAVAIHGRRGRDQLWCAAPLASQWCEALEECHPDTNLYRNALERLSTAELMPAERAEAILVLFVAVGCSADTVLSVTYAIDYAHATCGGAHRPAR